MDSESESHISEMFEDTKMMSGLYPFFHIALLNDFGSFALWMCDNLFESAHCSTASLPCLLCGPSAATRVIPGILLCLWLGVFLGNIDSGHVVSCTILIVWMLY